MRKMKNINKKIFFLILIFLLTFISLKAKVVYAKTEAEELKELLDEYEEDLGDLNQLKEVIDEIYNDLYTAEKVDDALKEKLNSGIEKFENIDGINPLLKTILDIELKSQVTNLTDDNIDEMREEISVIKEWVDSKVGNSENNGNNPGEDTADKDNNVTDKNQQNVQNGTTDKTIADKVLPKAGIKSIISILIIISIGAIFSIIRYIQLKEIE